MAPLTETNLHALKVTSLSGAVALVTGGSRGIGRAIALRLAAMGASVAICGRDLKALQSVEVELSVRTAHVFSQVADVTRSADVASLVVKTEAALGPHLHSGEQCGRRRVRTGTREIRGGLGSRFEHEFEERLPGLACGRALDDSRRPGRHHQYQLAGRAQCVCGRRTVLRVEVGRARVVRLHGGGSARTRDPRQRDLSGQRGYGVFRTGLEGPVKVLTPDDVAHAVAMVVTQGPQSFLSEIHLRPLRKA